MIRLRALYLLSSLIVCSTPFIAHAQCPQVEAMLVNACGTEQLNEFLIINSGGGFNTTDIIINYDANNNIISPQNNDVNTNVNNVAPGTPCGIAAGNIGAYTGCSNLISIGDGFTVPPNSIVIFQTSLGSTSSYNFSSLCGAGQCVYVVSSGCTRTAGAFTNAGGGTRTTVFDIAGSGCASQTITYSLSTIANVDGAYYLPLTNTYGSAGCVVPPSSPAPAGSTVNQPANVSVCANDAVNVPFTGTGSSYNWTNSNTNIGLGANGTGDISFTAANVATTQTGTITVTPAGSCPGPAKTFTITVNPAPIMNVPANVTVCAGAVVNVPFSGGGAGTTYSWTNDNTAVGLGASGNGNISFTSANVVNQEVATITVTPQKGTCPGPPVTVTVTVNPRPTADDPPNLSVCGGDPVSVVFTGTGSPNYSWTNSNASIGLGTSGTGDINFTAANVGGITTGIITVTPSVGGCTGPAQTFNISVNPAPTVNQPLNVVRCGGAVVAVNFSGSPAGTTFNWTNDNTSIGLGASGSGNLNFTSSNSANQEIATITVTPQLGICPGTPKTFTITINPTPTVDDPPNQSVCGGDPVDVMFTGIGSPTFTWTNSNPAIGLAGSGSGDISIIAANVNAITTGTITVTPTLGICVGTPQNFTITVNPTPTANQPTDVTVCGGAPVNVNFGGTPAGNIYNWTNDNPNIGLGISGAGNISFTSANVTTQEIANITVTPQNGICPGAARNFTIIINPKPVLTDPADQSVCAGDPVAVTFVATGNPTLSWTNSNPAIGLGASGTGNINFTAANVASTQTGTITVTPNSGGCPGLPQTFTVTVAPIPSANQPANVTVCAGAPVNVAFSGSSAGVTYSWINDNTTVGLGASGTGNISFTSALVATQQVANITVTPQFGTCPGIPRTFTVTINPTPVLTDPADQTVCAGDPVAVTFAATGNPTLSWTNSNPAIGLGASGSGNINFTAANVASTQTGTITVTPNAAGCPGAPQSFTVTVAPIPSANQPANVTVCAGAPVNVAFTGSPVGVTFSWTNNNPAVGLAASGTGNISFTSANVTTQEVATITVTPQSGTCPGVVRTFTITINPTPVLTDPADQTVCAGDPVAVIFAATGNPTLSWTNSNPAIGLGASGSGNINFNAANVASTQTGTITVTPNAAGCPGVPQSFTVTVAPIPSVNQPANVTVCAGAPVNVNFAGTPVGVTYSWTNDNPAVGLAANGTGNISFTSANVAIQQVANVTVTPQSGTCPGTARTFTITIKPAATLNQPADVLVCGGQPVNVAFSGTAGATFAWTNSNPAIGLGATGNGNINFTSPNVAAATTGTITVTPTANGCPGTPLTFLITVESQPSATSPGNQTLCGNQAVNIALTGSATSFSWTNSNPGIGLAASGTGNLVFTSTDVINQQTAVIQVTPQIGTCSGTPIQFTITLKPTPQVAQPADLQVCATNVLQIDFSGNQAGTNFNWTNDNLAIGLGASGTGSINFTAANVANSTVGNITVTPVLGTCTGLAQSFTVTVNPAATVTNPGNQTVCGNNPLNINFIGSAGTNFNWTNNNPVIGLGASGTGNISFTSANVASATTGTISVTPALGTCTGPTQTFDITVVTIPTATNPGTKNACANAPVSVNFGTGNTVYNWTNSNPAIGLPASGTGNLSFNGANVTALETAQITVTPVLGTCTGVAETFTIQINPAPVAAIAGNIVLCNGDGTTLTASGGTSYAWNGGQMTNSITVAPNATTNYSVIVTDAAACTSIANTTVTVNPLNITQLSSTSCSPLDTGVVVNTFLNQFGCDSTVIKTTKLLPSNVVNFSNVTCNPANAGVFTQNLKNTFGCDSTVINTVTFNPANIDTTILKFTTCIPANVDTTQNLLVGLDGCDSLVITRTTLLASNVVNLSSVTCKPNLAGVFTQNLKNIFGCDSTVVTTVVFDKSLIDTTFLTAKTCNPAQVGLSTKVVAGSNTCDSILITNTSLAPSYALSFSNVTCKPSQAGVFTQTLTTIFGCDSILTTTVVFDPSLIDSTFLTAQTCNPAQVGKTTKTLTGLNGCDSLVITNTTLAPPITNTVNQLTCKPNNVGTFIDTYNINGCDSVVTRIVVFDPSQIDTTKLTLTTCDPTQTGVLSTTLTGKDGCDSIVIRTTVYDPTLCAPTGAISSKSTSCADKIDGSVTFSLNAGSPPFQYNWTDGQGNTGTGQVANLNTPVQITGLAPGSFTLNVTQAIGPALVLQSTVPAPAPLSALAVPLQIYNGYSVRCAGDTDGSATLAASGGTAPYQYQWSNGDTLVTATKLSEGDYTVTITDRNNCPTTSIASISAPDPLTFLLAIERPKCGEQVANVTVTPLGGVQLYDILLDSKLLSSPTASIGSGTHNIVVQDANDCFADSTLDIVIPESGVISLPSDTIVQLGEVLTIEAQTNLTVWQSIRWSPAPDTSCVDCLSQTWKPLVSGIYSVTQIDTFGCISKATIRVIVKKTSPLYVPNIFSPDNLNDNDFFTIGGGPSVRQIEELRIFDRWGNVVYNLDAPIGPNEWPGWDGKQGNKAVSVGVYVYYIKVRLVTGELEVVEGDLTVIKN